MYLRLYFADLIAGLAGLIAGLVEIVKPLQMVNGIVHRSPPTDRRTAPFANPDKPPGEWIHMERAGDVEGIVALYPFVGFGVIGNPPGVPLALEDFQLYPNPIGIDLARFRRGDVAPVLERQFSARGFVRFLAVQTLVGPEKVVMRNQPVNVGLAGFPPFQPP